MLTVNRCKTVKEPGRYGDGRGGRGLALNVHLTREGRVTKSWTQRIRVEGRLTNIGLGRFPEVSLAEARDLAIDNVRAARDGNEVRQPRVAAKVVPTFAECHAAYIELNAAGWTAQSVRDWHTSFERYCPTLMGKPVTRIEPTDVVKVLSAIDKPTVLPKMRARIAKVLDWARAHGYIVVNAAEGIEAALPQRNGNGGHHEAPDVADAPAEFARVLGFDIAPMLRELFAFTVLTAVRKTEALAAEWSEIDFDAAVWTIPAERIKTGEAHRVPLSPEALRALRQARQIAEDAGIASEHCFPSPRGGTYGASWPRMLRAQGIEWTLHGFARSTFSDWAIEAGHDSMTVERALAHKDTNKVRAAYTRTDLLEARRPMMAAWADYLVMG